MKLLVLFSIYFSCTVQANEISLKGLPLVESLTSTETMKLENFLIKDNSIILDFWASWCGPCKESLPKLAMLQKNNPKVKVILLNVDEEKKEGVDFLKNHPELKDLAVYFDKNKTVAEALKVEAIPSTFIFSDKGELKKRIRGYRSSTHDEILKAL